MDKKIIDISKFPLYTNKAKIRDSELHYLVMVFSLMKIFNGVILMYPPISWNQLSYFNGLRDLPPVKLVTTAFAWFKVKGALQKKEDRISRLAAAILETINSCELTSIFGKDATSSKIFVSSVLAGVIDCRFTMKMYEELGEEAVRKLLERRTLSTREKRELIFLTAKVMTDAVNRGTDVYKAYNQSANKYSCSLVQGTALLIQLIVMDTMYKYNRGEGVSKRLLECFRRCRSRNEQDAIPEGEIPTVPERREPERREYDEYKTSRENDEYKTNEAPQERTPHTDLQETESDKVVEEELSLTYEQTKTNLEKQKKAEEKQKKDKEKEIERFKSRLKFYENDAKSRDDKYEEKDIRPNKEVTIRKIKEFESEIKKHESKIKKLESLINGIDEAYRKFVEQSS